MPLLKPEFHKTLAEAPRLWASRFDVPLSQIEKMLVGDAKIHAKTAEKFRKKYADLFKLDCKVEDLFDPECFIGADNRTVNHVFAEVPMSEDKKLGVFRFLFEKRFAPAAVSSAVSLLILIFHDEFKLGAQSSTEGIVHLWGLLVRFFQHLLGLV